MASPNRNPGTLDLFVFIFHVNKFYFSKMSRPESLARPEWRIRTGARFTPTFSFILSKHFIMSFLFRFSISRKHSQMVGPQTFTFHQCNYSEGILCPFKMIYKTKHFFRVQLFVHKIFHVQKGYDMHGGVCTYTPQLAL